MKKHLKVIRKLMDQNSKFERRDFFFLSTTNNSSPIANYGFTLLELTIVIGVLVVIAGIVGGILAFSLRSVNKTTILTTVNQNGDYAINTMAENIKFAKRFAGVSSDGTTFTTDCTGSSGTNYQYLKIIGFDNGITTYSCGVQNDANGYPNIASASAATVSLLNTVSVALVTGSCNFTCTQNTSIDPPVIGISFSLQQRANTSLVENTVSPIPFQTSVVMRNR